MSLSVVHPAYMEPFPSVLRRYDAHLDVNGRSEATRRKYRYELLCWWVDWFHASDLDLNQLRPGHLEEYLATLSPNGGKRSDATRALKSFCGWASREGDMDTDPALHLRIPRRRTGPAPDMTEADFRQLLRFAFRRESRRGWAILLCYVTGARIGSLLAVRPEDVHLGDSPRVDLLKTKGDRPYSVPLERAGVIAVGHLMSCCGSHRTDPRLIGVGQERFRQWIHAAEQEAGLGRVWPHLLRHAASTRVARKTDPETWRRFMGHSDLAQWSRYVAGTDERLRKAVPLG